MELSPKETRYSYLPLYKEDALVFPQLKTGEELSTK
jgi:hypothetical protein